MRKKNTLNPPKDKTFPELINFIWDHGLGNECGVGDIPVPWTADSLEAAFFTIGFDVDRRSFQNWRQGVHKADRKNIHAISKVVSAGNHDLQRLWASALLLAPKITNVEKTTEYDEAKPKFSLRTVWREYHQFFVGLVVGGLPTVAILAMMYFNQKNEVTITNVSFCDEAGFSKTAQKCHIPSSHFPEGTSRIYVSFDANNADDGQPFDRKWYYKSRLIAEKPGYFDSAWPGFTFLGDGQSAFENGKYDLRIIVNGRTSTHTFIIGTFDPSKVNPIDFRDK